MATAASSGSQTATGVSSGEGDLCLLPPGKALSAAILDFLPAILLEETQAAPCHAARVKAGDKTWQWEAPLGPPTHCPSLHPVLSPHPSRTPAILLPSSAGVPLGTQGQCCCSMGSKTSPST